MNEIKKKLWIVSELFYPDETSTAYILTKIANTLTLKYEVNVLCGHISYDKDKPQNKSSQKLSEDIKIFRTNISGNKNNIFSRSVYSSLLSSYFFFNLYKKIKQSDVILIVTNPPFLILLISFLRRLKKNRLVVLVHDVFPENLIAMGFFKSTKNLFYILLKSVIDWSYNQTDTLIVLGDDMKEVITSKTKNNKKILVEVVRNWAETNLVYPLNTNNYNNNKIRLLFAGNLGRFQGLKKLILFISKIDNPNLDFIFAGSGSMKNEIQKIVEKMNLRNVYFKDTFLRKEQIELFNQSEICLVTLIDDYYGLGVPSKSYNILAAGKPILFIGNKRSEIAEMILKNGIGYVFSFEEEKLIIEFLNNLSLKDIDIFKSIGGKARRIAENEFSEELILKKYLEII